MIYLPLDLVGENPDNVKTKDYSINDPLSVTRGQVIVPEFGVFHPIDLLVIHVDTGSELKLGIDYYLTYYSTHLKAQYDIDGYAGIVLVNKTLSGNVRLTTRYLGGGYIKFNSTVIVDVVELINGVPVSLDWDAVVDAPAKSNPNTHSLPAEKIATGYQDFAATLLQLSNQLKAISESSVGTKYPIGGQVSTILPNTELNPFYWLAAEGQTITREDYPLFFMVLKITSNTYVMPVLTNTYIRIN